MRRQYKQRLQRFLAEQLMRFRTEQNLSQEMMAEKLAISPRAYIDLEHGKYACSMMTCLLFLLGLKDEAVLQLLRECRSLLEDDDRDAA